MRRSRAIAAAAICVIAVGVTRAHGDAAIEARYFDQRARAQFARGRYADALELFMQVHAVAPSPGTLYNIGVSAALSGEPAVAYAHFDEFVRSGGADDSRRADAERRMAELERGLARVRVETTPPGATIWVDRRELGDWGRTPRTVVLDPGAHEIELEIAGHVSRRVEATAVRGQLAEVRETLERQQGRLRVEVVPPNAEVSATDPSGTAHQLPPNETSVLATGPYDVLADAAGHRPDRRGVVIRPDALETLRLAPEPIPPRTGRVLVSAGDVRADVIVDGTARGVTPARIDGIAVGAHAVEIRAEGFVPWRGSVEVEPDRGVFVDVTLVRAR